MRDKNFKAQFKNRDVFDFIRDYFFRSCASSRRIFDQAGAYLSDGGKTFGNAAGRFSVARSSLAKSALGSGRVVLKIPRLKTMLRAALKIYGNKS